MNYAEKLGLEAGMRWDVVAGPNDYLDNVGPLLSSLRQIPRREAGLHCIHYFERSRAELRRHLAQMRQQVLDHGMIWVSWPHPATRIICDVSEKSLALVAEVMGLTIVEVIELDSRWMAAKLVRDDQVEQDQS